VDYPNLLELHRRMIGHVSETQASTSQGAAEALLDEMNENGG